MTVSIEIVITFVDRISLMRRPFDSLHTELINNSWPSAVINGLINPKLSDLNTLKVIVSQT